MPHPIPANPASIEGWRYYVVAIPDDDVAVSAAWAVYSELMNIWAWGLEGVEDDSATMAQVWAEALFETIRIREMGFPDDVLAYIDEIEPLLRALADQACCANLPGAGDIIGETEGDISESATDRSTGTWPTGIANESEWDAYICNAATALVDRLIETPSYIYAISSWSIAAVTALVLWYAGGAYIALAGITAITMGTLFGWLASVEELIDAITGETEPAPSTVESELTAAREDLICAVVTANDHAAAGAALRGAIAEAVSSTAWTNILFLLTGNGVMASVFDANNQDAPDANCPACILDPAPFELAFVYMTPTGSLGGQPITWSSPGTYSRRIQWSRADSLSTSMDLRCVFNLNTIDCAVAGYDTATVSVKVSGTWNGGTGHLADVLDLDARWGRSETCPPTQANDGSNTTVGPDDVTDGGFFEYTLVQEIDLVTGGTWKEIRMGGRIAEWANAVDVTFEITDVEFA